MASIDAGEKAVSLPLPLQPLGHVPLPEIERRPFAGTSSLTTLPKLEAPPPASLGPALLTGQPRRCRPQAPAPTPARFASNLYELSLLQFHKISFSISSELQITFTNT